MDIGTLRALVTLVLFVLFVALVVSAYAGRRRADFEAAARMPLEDDDDD